MRRGRTLIFIILIIIIGLVVAYVAYRQFSVPEAPPAPAYVEIYIAVQNIPQGGKITPELLSTIKIAPESLVSVMYTVDEQGSLVGKVAKYPLDQGVVITEAMVSDAAAAVPISGPQWASLIPPGMTAVSISTPDKLALAGYGVNTGAHVNVNACFKFVDIDPTFQSALPNQITVLTGTGFITETGAPVLTLGAAPSGTDQGRLELDPSLQQPYYLIPREAQRPRLVCQMLLQDVVVMRAGDFPLDPAASITTVPVTTNPDTGATTPIVPNMVTLIVSPQDSITISYLRETAAILSLTLRNPTDQLRQATEAATLQFLLSQYNIPVPAKLPYAQ
jgi:Flp pilus assembly protein CpaB